MFMCEAFTDSHKEHLHTPYKTISVLYVSRLINRRMCSMLFFLPFALVQNFLSESLSYVRS